MMTPGIYVAAAALTTLESPSYIDRLHHTRDLVAAALSFAKNGEQRDMEYLRVERLFADLRPKATRWHRKSQQEESRANKAESRIRRLERQLKWDKDCRQRLSNIQAWLSLRASNHITEAELIESVRRNVEGLS